MPSRERTFSFTVLPHGQRSPRNARSRAYLLSDNWDDWFKYSTVYVLIVFDEHGTEHHIGQVKIGQIAMRSDQRSPKLPSSFEDLGKNFFSLGQDDSYYENLNKLGDDLRDLVVQRRRRPRAGAVVGPEQSDLRLLRRASGGRRDPPRGDAREHVPALRPGLAPRSRGP